ncbi:MAG: FAD:protein FMN transferase [Caulobacter sp.]|nr:FAD:protein FMN transferase [Caulobacter sp.]
MIRVLVPQLTKAPARPIGGAVLTLAGETMGTTWSMQLVAPLTANAEALEAMAQRELDQVVREMSPWEPLSDLSRYNRAAAGSWTPLPPALAQVLRCALEIAEASDGAFDPTLGALVDLWGFGPLAFSGAPPHPQDIAKARQAAGWRRLVLEGDRLLQPGGLRLDLNGIAKGFAVDQVAAALDRAGVRSYLIEVGGELRGTGAKPDGQPWWVELESPPVANDRPRTLVALHGLSVATSGDYRRFFEHDGRRYAHTLDPATAAPAAHATVSVTVLDESCMRADAYATALTVMAPDAALAFATEHGVAAIILAQGPTGLEEHLSPAVSAMLDE